jgi:hypothetical protein
LTQEPISAELAVVRFNRFLVLPADLVDWTDAMFVFPEPHLTVDPVINAVATVFERTRQQPLFFVQGSGGANLDAKMSQLPKYILDSGKVFADTNKMRTRDGVNEGVLLLKQKGIYPQTLVCLCAAFRSRRLLAILKAACPEARVLLCYPGVNVHSFLLPNEERDARSPMERAAQMMALEVKELQRRLSRNEISLTEPIPSEISSLADQFCPPEVEAYELESRQTLIP